MKKKIIALICVLISIIPLAGCWDRVEPSQMSVVTSIIYDYNENGFETTFEILKPDGGKSDKEGGGSGNNIILTKSGPTITDSVKNISVSAENKFFGGNNKIRIFSENFAKEHMGSALDFLIRDNITDELPYMIVFKGDNPKDIYSADIGLSGLTGTYLEQLIENQIYELSTGPMVTTMEFMKAYLDEGINPVAGVISLKEEKTQENSEAEGGKPEETSKKSIVYEGLAAFKGDKFAGYMDADETKAYNVITKKAKEFFLNIKNFEGGVLSSEIKKPKCKIKVRRDGENYILAVNVEITSVLIQKDPFYTGKSDKEIGGIIADSFKADIEKSIIKAQSLKTDIFGFSRRLYINNYNHWKNIEKIWDDEIFPNAKIEVNVKCKSKESVKSNIYNKGA